ncbi:glycosyltransferase family 2 protein [Nocardia sp. alder85J]|uniref:glycosyltransferase family 2 protein n=1 Tax=Nocardia sp. alder85J TaxID=2862949 RepID=UPI001CD6150B|nr:glycosyltransferase family 2 protein [Nocardia sp. alder85J]MCX4098752.1 glycosyltransferase family 2 protein [Nocardia sp. alder85J]
MKLVVTAGTGIAAVGCALAAVNRMTVRRLGARATAVIEPVTVCVPARDEAGRLPGLIADLQAQRGISRLRVLILDDASTDGTNAAALDAIGDDLRFTLLDSAAGPGPGWTGKTAACARLAEFAYSTDDSAATPTGVLVFLDADVRLAPEALAAAVGELRSSGAALVSPWPYQRTGSRAEALVQPLLCWSWASTLPIATANRSLRPSTVVSCGQFLALDAAAYRAAGGHAAVAGAVTEDLALARLLRRAGHRTALVAAGRLASTRMYSGATELDDGYTRWLWSAYGSPIGSVAVGALAGLAYLVPPLAAILGRGATRRLGLLGYACAVTGRLLTRSLESGRRPRRADATAALAHPASIAAYLTLSTRSHLRHRAGTLQWKGRTLPAPTAHPSAAP